MGWQSALAANRILVLDGGTGSELKRRGISLSPQCWSAAANLEHIELLSAIHRDFVAAGADLITANTFAATRFVLTEAGLEGRFEEIVRNALRAATQAARDSSREVGIAASLSCLPPSFDVARYPAPDSEYRAYAELAESFAENGADVVFLEMMQHPPHANSACRAVRASGLPFWAGISCRLARASTTEPADSDAKDTEPLVSFDDPAVSFDEVLQALLPFDPAGIAIMHTPADAMLPALRKLRERFAGKIGAYAEIPYAQESATAVESPISPQTYAGMAGEWIEAGAVLIGGCCGTTPAHIAALRRLVDARNRNPV